MPVRNGHRHLGDIVMAHVTSLDGPLRAPAHTRVDADDGRFCRVPAAFADDNRASVKAMRTMLSLCYFVGPDGLAWPKHQTLADKLGYSLKMFGLAIKELRYLGWIDLVRRKSDSRSRYVGHAYRINSHGNDRPIMPSVKGIGGGALGAIKQSRKNKNHGVGTTDTDHGVAANISKGFGSIPTPGLWFQ